jgi:hypothetical protein
LIEVNLDNRPYLVEVPRFASSSTLSSLIGTFAKAGPGDNWLPIE